MYHYRYQLRSDQRYVYHELLLKEKKVTIKYNYKKWNLRFKSFFLFGVFFLWQKREKNPMYKTRYQKEPVYQKKIQEKR